MGQDRWGMWDGMSGACGMGQQGMWDVSHVTVGPFGVCQWGYLGHDGGAWHEGCNQCQR